MPAYAAGIPGKGTPHDPRGLIQESFRIEGITEADCRSIFFDWVLGLPAETASEEAIRFMLELHRDEPDGHPMKAVLREGLQPPARRGRSPRRRKGGQ